jgi:hypothetical protein
VLRLCPGARLLSGPDEVKIYRARAGGRLAFRRTDWHKNSTDFSNHLKNLSFGLRNSSRNSGKQRYYQRQNSNIQRQDQRYFCNYQQRSTAVLAVVRALLYAV